jgi:hypothetical protein
MRGGIEAFDADPAAVLPFLDPEIECHVNPRIMNAGTWHGHDGYREMVASWTEAWGEYGTEAVGFDTPDDDHVIVEVNQTGTGSVSGVPVEMRVFFLADNSRRQGGPLPHSPRPRIGPRCGPQISSRAAWP